MSMSITMINAFCPRSLNVIYHLYHTRQPTHIIHHVAFFIRPLLPPHFGQWKVGDHDAGKSSPTRGYETARNVIRRSGPTSRRHTPPPHPPLHDGCINTPRISNQNRGCRLPCPTTKTCHRNQTTVMVISL